MGRSPCCSKEGMNRGAWTAVEDRILAAYIKVHGEGKWRNLPKRAGLKRCGKSCRLRWLNYLRPDIKRGNISPEEEELIIRLHKLLGNRWSLIAGRLPGRTDNEIKNYWNTTLGKKMKVGVGAHSSPESQSSSKQSPTAKTTKSNSTAKRPPTLTDRQPKSSSKLPPPPPPSAIRTKALRCTKVVAPTRSDHSLLLNNNPTVENSLHVDLQAHDQSHSNSIIKPQLEVQCTTTQQHSHHGIEEKEKEEPFKFSCHDFEAHNYDQTLFKDWTACEFLHDDNGSIDLGYLASLLDNCEEWP